MYCKPTAAEESLFCRFCCHKSPISANADGYNVLLDSRIVEQMLLESHSPLLAIKLGIELPHPELYVQVCDALIEDITVQFWFDQLIPYRFWVEMQIATETTRDNCPALELAPKLRWYSQPALIVEFSFEVVYLRAHCVSVPVLIC